MDAPTAAKRPVARELHGESFIDNYAWLRDRENPETIAYLEAENRFTEASLDHLASIRSEIFEEIRSRVLEDDISAPARRGDWWYASETHEGSQYPTLVRMYGGPDGEHQVTLDVNEIAAGHDYTRLGTFNVSPSQRFALWSVDHDGSERFSLRIRDLESGTDLPGSHRGRLLLDSLVERRAIRVLHDCRRHPPPRHGLAPRDRPRSVRGRRGCRRTGQTDVPVDRSHQRPCPTDRLGEFVGNVERLVSSCRRPDRFLRGGASQTAGCRVPRRTPQRFMAHRHQ